MYMQLAICVCKVASYKTYVCHVILIIVLMNAAATSVVIHDQQLLAILVSYIAHHVLRISFYIYHYSITVDVLENALFIRAFNYMCLS